MVREISLVGTVPFWEHHIVRDVHEAGCLHCGSTAPANSGVSASGCPPWGPRTGSPPRHRASGKWSPDRPPQSTPPSILPIRCCKTSRSLIELSAAITPDCKSSNNKSINSTTFFSASIVYATILSQGVNPKEGPAAAAAAPAAIAISIAYVASTDIFTASLPLPKRRNTSCLSFPQPFGIGLNSNNISEYGLALAKCERILGPPAATSITGKFR